jgi:predicted MFS family arabinose efflux permease
MSEAQRLVRGPRGYGEFRDGWRLVLASMLGVALGATPVPFYTIGLFAPQLAKAFHWGFGQIQLGVLVASLTGLACVPVVGLLADRVGVRATALTSLALFGLSFMSFALSTPSLPQFYLTWGVMGVLGAGSIPITWTRAINNRFDERKGLALGLCLMGTGVFGILCKPVVTWWISTLGWRGAYVAVGLLPIVIALPVGLAFFHDGPPRPGGVAYAGPQAAESERRSGTTGFSLAQAVRQWRFWLIAGAVGATAFAVGGPTPNMENILATHGFSLAQVTSLTPLIGGSVILGRLASGWLMDRVWAPAVGCVLLCLPAVACLMLAGRGLSYAAAFGAIAMIGLAAGMESDLVAFLVARYFGISNYASIYSLIYLVYALGGAVAASAFGRAYDLTHAYSGILTVAAVLLAAGAVSFLTLGAYRFSHREA